MANVFAALNKLKTNIFGGPGNTGFTKPPASRVQDIDLQESPTGLLRVDPLSINTFSYPMDVQQNFQNGHYMLFYVNVQDKTKYTYKTTSRTKVSDYDDIKGSSNDEVRYKKVRDIKTGRYRSEVGANVLDEHGTNGNTGSVKKGVSALFNNTTRISDSVALYLPPNVEDNTTAGYNDMRTGLAGYLAATGIDLRGKDAAAIAQSVVASGGQLLDAAAKRAVSELAEVTLGAEGTTELINKAFGQADNPYMEVLFDAMALRTFTYNFNFAPKNQQEAFEV